MKIPENIQRFLNQESYETDQVGMSDAKVLLFSDKVLKIEPESQESAYEYSIMKWLKGKLPVPEVLAFEKENGKNYLLMSRLCGEMACSERYMKTPDELVTLLAKGMELLWQVNITHCPFINNLDKKLKIAEYRVLHSMVDVEDTEPDTFTRDFQSPAHLLDWLKQNKPEEELVFTHGDYCLPNIFFKDGSVNGFIDLGRAGVADKWQDIALCYRSLKHNKNGLYGGGQYEGVSPDLLFDRLTIQPDWDKIRYYILLDELF